MLLPSCPSVEISMLMLLEQQPDFAQVAYMARLPPEMQVSGMGRKSDSWAWLSLRNQLMMLLQNGFTTAQILQLGIERSVLMACVGDLAFQDTSSPAAEEGPLPGSLDGYQHAVPTKLPQSEPLNSEVKNESDGPGSPPNTSGDVCTKEITRAADVAPNDDLWIPLFESAPQLPVADTTSDSICTPSLPCGEITNGHHRESDTEEGEICEDMDLEENELMRIVDRVWETVKVGGSFREGKHTRPTATELNNVSPYTAGYAQPRPFIRERFTNYIIDLSESEEEDVNEAASELNHRAVKLKTGTEMEAVRKRMEELEQQKKALQKKMRLIAARKRKAEAKGPLHAPVTEITSSAGNISEAKLPVRNQASKVLAPATAAVQPSSGSKSVVSSSSISAAPVVAAETATSEELSKLVSATRHLRQQQLEAAVLYDETSFAAAQAEVVEKERDRTRLQTQMQEVHEKRNKAQGAITQRRALLEELQRQIEEDEVTVASCLKVEEELASQLSLLDRGISAHGSKMSHLHETINAKRREISDLTKESQREDPQPERIGAKRSNPSPAGMLSKRLKLSNPETQHGDVQRADSHFIEFLKKTVSAIDIFKPSESQLGANREQLSCFPNLELEKLQGDLPWQENVTIEPLMAVCGYLRRESDLGRILDVYRSPFPANGRWNCEHEEVHSINVTHDTAGDGICKKKLSPYNSTLSRFRSFRFSKDYDKDIKSLTWSNKVDPFQNLCRFELEGGKCFDEKCKGQHFRDITMSEEEMILDLISYNTFDHLPLEKIRELKEGSQAAGAKVSAIGDLTRAIQQQKPREDSIISISLGRRHDLKGLLKGNNSTNCPAQPYREDVERETQSTGKHSHTSEIASLAPPVLYLPPRVPVLISGIQKNANGENLKSGRYFQASISEEDSEMLVARSPRTVENWVNYAIEALPDLTNNELEKSSGNLNKVLNILSRALQANRSSEVLWEFYLELFCRRGKEEDVRESFEQALQFLPKSLQLGWRWFLWETASARKEAVLKRMINALISGSEYQGALIDLVLQVTRICLDDGRVKSAKAWLWTFLTATSPTTIPIDTTSDGISTGAAQKTLPDLCKTVAFEILSKADLALAWLTYLHLLYFEDLPCDLFHDYPYHYLVKRRFWEVVWLKRRNRPEDTDNSVEHIHNIFDHIITSWKMFTQEGERMPYVALLRNYCNFLRQVARQEPDEIRTYLMKTIQAHANIPDLWDLHGLLEESFGEVPKAMNAMKMYLQRVPEEFALWNRYAKLTLVSGNWDDLIRILVNCVRAIFVGLDDIHTLPSQNICGIVDEALLLYRKALALSVPTHRAPEVHPHLARTQLKSNVYLWLNYLMLQSLHISDGEAPREIRQSFDHAVEAVKEADSRHILWMEYLRFELAAGPEDSIPKDAMKRTMSVLGRALRDIKVEIPHPGRPQSSSMEFMKMVPLRDLALPCRLWEVCFTAYPADKQAELIDLVVHGQLPLGASPLTAKAALRLGNVVGCQHILYASLKLNPKRGLVWTMAILLDYRTGNLQQAELLFKHAKQYVAHLPQV
ncbi:hypothetical protein SpCBS45565_g01178 [Spizellomyces sp. 'palustris']|nr:hypothetical protein SpCBS45565_g01178 [Spizellomyces sp. 'palustris']